LELRRWDLGSTGNDSVDHGIHRRWFQSGRERAIGVFDIGGAIGFLHWRKIIHRSLQS
jgi:hypothetical protein